MRFTYSDVTPQRLYWSRRDFMLAAAAAAAAGGIWAPAAEATTPQGAPLAAQRNARFSLAEAATKFESATTYNNFYEFGVNKEDPSRLAGTLRPRPWSVQVEGLVAKARSGRARKGLPKSLPPRLCESRFGIEGSRSGGKS